jgi:DNA-binding phage protein
MSSAPWVIGEGRNMMKYEQFESVWDAIGAKPRHETVVAVMRALNVKMVAGVM